MNKLKETPALQVLQSKAYKITLSEQNLEKQKRTKFDFDKFVKLAEKVKKTFKDEDILRLRLNIRPE